MGVNDEALILVTEENERLRAELTTAKEDADRWKTNHDIAYGNWVERERRLTAARQDLTEAVEALRKIRCTPAMPFPDPEAHSWRAYGTAVYRAYCDIQRAAAAIVTRFGAQGPI